MKVTNIVRTVAFTAFMGSAILASAQVTIVPDTTRQLKVTGKGNAQAAPDSATVTLGVSARDMDLQIAKETVDKCVIAMLELVTSVGIEETNIRTTALFVSPQYSFEDRDLFLGYEATRSLTVHLKELDKLDQLLDGAVGAGANSEFDVSLSSSQEDELRTTARQRAIEDARNQAEDAAKQLGVRIAGVRSITLDPPNRNIVALSPVTYGQRESTFLPGDVTIESEVSVVFLLEDSVSEE